MNTVQQIPQHNNTKMISFRWFIAQKLLIGIGLITGFFLTGCAFLKPTNFSTQSDVKQAVLPQEEAPHFQNALEWWYFTGHLHDVNTQDTFGIEYVFFHFNPRKKDDYMMVNIAISDPQKDQFLYDYKVQKLDNPLAATLPIELDVSKKQEVWHIDGQEGIYHLKARMTTHKDAAIDLTTSIDKPIALHDGTGYAIYGEIAKAGYYSYPRLSTKGTMEINGEVRTVEGDLWYDRQWDCMGVINRDVAWDWMSIQFDDPKEELMLYIVHDYGKEIKVLGGTHLAANGTNTSLGQKDIEVEELEFWTSKASKSTYPLKWQVKVPKLGYDVVINPVMPHQELGINFTPLLPKMYYWEGMCRVKGTQNGKPIKGNSYVEITNRKRFE
ncbi:MAG: lipocalin family protein [Chitinophagales bacterium]